jgi:hypothetical protein
MKFNSDFYALRHKYDYLVELGFQNRSSCLEGKHFTNLSYTPSPLPLVIFQRVFPVFFFFLTSIRFFYASSRALITDMCLHVSFWIWNGILLNFLPMMALEHISPNPHLPSNWDYKHEQSCPVLQNKFKSSQILLCIMYFNYVWFHHLSN